MNDDSGWNEVLQDVDVLMHTASPFPLSQPSDESDLIRPAVDGTLRALQAAKNASVNRVILTSSIVAVMPSALKPGSAKHNEDNWTNLDSPGLTAYAKSKTLAEQAAWDFVRDQAPTINLTVINPGFVMGPPLDTNFGTSIRVVERLLKAKDPAIPQFGFNCVDVRDIARCSTLQSDPLFLFWERKKCRLPNAPVTLWEWNLQKLKRPCVTRLIF